MENVNTDILTTGITAQSLQTVNGMVVVNCMVAIVIDNASKHAFKDQMAWIYLVTSVIISLGVCLFVNRRKTGRAVFLALLAVFPVYIGTTGANTILSSYSSKQDDAAKTQVPNQSSMIELPAFLQTKSWWLDDVIEEANQNAAEKTEEADLATKEKNDVATSSEKKLDAINEQMDEIIKTPQKAIQIAENIKEITGDAKRNLNKQTGGNLQTGPLPKQTPNTSNQNSVVSNQNSKAMSSPVTEVFTKVKPEDFQKAKDLEKQGFQFILSNNFSKAKDSFAECENSYPRYHNCYDIVDYLKANSNKDAKEIYKTILTKYSWGMPSEVRTAMRKFTEVLPPDKP
jgi:hypothetical protein